MTNGAGPTRSLLPHETLDVYWKALNLLDRLDDLARVMGPDRDLADQVRRAAASVVLNIAEGAGEFKPADKARFYRYARRSVAEGLAGAEIAVRRKIVDAESIRAAQEDGREVAMILLHLIRGAENRKARA